jgi:hypothetical protein
MLVADRVNGVSTAEKQKTTEFGLKIARAPAEIHW